MKKKIIENTLSSIPANTFKKVLLVPEYKTGIAADEIRTADETGLASEGDCTYDAVISINALHKFENSKKALCEIHRVLKSGGSFFACLKPYDSFRTELKELFDVNSYRTDGGWAYFEAQKKERM
ncbi:MAG: class I SAM-dependent methyltransferase [Ruminococcaceae bacterium]|nr:class I SAM-dependent methyltransferase [Oscillospiraceae bacterium]